MRVLEEPTVVVEETEIMVLLENADLTDSLQKAADDFTSRHVEAQARNTRLRLVQLDGPYKASADLLLSQFYKEDNLGSFWAVLKSGLPSIEQVNRLLRAACKDGSITYLSLLLMDERVTADTADELLKIAYDNEDVSSFFLIFEHASPEGRQQAKDQAVQDRQIAFFGAMEEMPSAEAIDAMLDGMGNSLDVGIIAMIADSLTEEQALRIASMSYEQNDIGVFSIVVDCLKDTDQAAFRQRARQDKNVAFYAVTE